MSNQSVPQDTDGTPHRFKVLRLHGSWQQTPNAFYLKHRGPTWQNRPCVKAWLWNGRRVRIVSYSTDINTSHTPHTHTSHTGTLWGFTVMFPHAGPKMSLAYLTCCTLNSPTAPRLFNLHFHISPQTVYDVSLLCSTTPH